MSRPGTAQPRKAGRVRSRREYRAIQQHGVRATLPHFVMIFARRAVDAASRAPGPRLGIVASRRVGHAVLRNRGKRLVREAFRASRGLFPADIDVVVVVKRVPDGLASVLAEWEAARPLLERRMQAARRAADV